MLKEYAAKRNFKSTSEPAPSPTPVRKGDLTFCVQKHAARRLHYDVRLEFEGALLSWAVPKGPSLNPADKRMAVKVEDHPLDYAGFEGSIPKGQYGGGQVIVWDRGTYQAVKGGDTRASQEDAVRDGLAKGDLKVSFNGQKLKGEWVFVHTNDDQWLMIKHRDQFASEDDVLAQDRSVISSRTIEDIEKGREAPEDPFEEPEPAKLPRFTPPLQVMLPSEVDKPFSNPDWTFELKLDGVRVLAVLDRDGTTIVTRNENDVTSRLKPIVRDLEAVSKHRCVLDGEIVLFDADGRPSFQGLMEGFKGGVPSAAVFCVFDILALDGKDVRNEPWKDRRKKLESIPFSGDHIKLLDTFPEDGELLYKHATDLGLEGVVAKKLDSAYESGKRSKNWLKVKEYHTDEFTVGGYTKGKGARGTDFGAMLLGFPTPEGLEYVGSVGGGFSDKQLSDLGARLQLLKIEKSPFKEKLPIKDTAWTKPEMVVEVRYMSKTRDGKLRFPVFVRERPDLSRKTLIEESKPVEHTGLNTLAEAFAGNEKELSLEVEGHKIRFTNLDKELWPSVTKRDLLAYYAAASPMLLPHLKDRPISYVRCPDGVGGERFFQKHWDKGRPEFVETVKIYSDHSGRATEFVLCNNLPTLLSLGQIAAVELNPWNSRITPEPGGDKSEVDFSSSKAALENSLLNNPDYLVFDFDPHFGGKASGWKEEDWKRLVEAANALKGILGELKLKSFLKSSGKSGLHAYVPVAREYTYDQIRAAAHELGRHVALQLPKKVTLEWNVKTRPNGVFIDANQNVRGKTMAAAYSPRAHDTAGVSTPVAWSELDTFEPTKYTVTTVCERLAQVGDLWAEMETLHQRLVT